MSTPTFPTVSRNMAAFTFNNTENASHMSLSALGEHLRLCQGSNGRWFALHCAAESLHGFIASRFVTTLVTAGVLACCVAFVL